MSPQPASARLGDRLVQYRPWTSDHERTGNIALPALEVIALWARIDMAFVRMTALFLGITDWRHIARMLTALTGGRARRDAIHAAANSALTVEDFAIFEAVLKAISGSRKQRDKYAHHIWMVTDSDPDRIFLVDPTDIIEADMAIFTPGIDPRTVLRMDMLEELHDDVWEATIDRAHIFSYSASAAQRHRRDARRALELTLTLEKMMIGFPTQKEGGEARQALLSAREVENALANRSLRNDS